MKYALLVTLLIFTNYLFTANGKKNPETECQYNVPNKYSGKRLRRDSKEERKLNLRDALSLLSLAKSHRR